MFPSRGEQRESGQQEAIRLLLPACVAIITARAICMQPSPEEWNPEMARSKARMTVPVPEMRLTCRCPTRTDTAVQHTRHIIPHSRMPAGGEKGIPS